MMHSGRKWENPWVLPWPPAPSIMDKTTLIHWQGVVIFNIQTVTVKSEHYRHLLSGLRVGNVNLSSSVVSTGLLGPRVADRHHDLLGNAAMAPDRGPHPAWFGIHGIEDIVVLAHFLGPEK